MPKNSDPAQAKQPPRSRYLILGEAIKDARAAWHISSQARLAEAAGISERSVAGIEAGEKVGRKTLAAIAGTFGWPVSKMTDYLDGDDAALNALPTQPAARRLADIGLTMDITSEPDCVRWLRELRASLSDEKFFQLIEQMSRPQQGADN